MIELISKSNIMNTVYVLYMYIALETESLNHKIGTNGKILWNTHFIKRKKLECKEVCKNCDTWNFFKMYKN